MSTQTLVAYYADELREATGSPIPRRIAGQLASEIAQLIRDGIPEEGIKDGLRLMLKKNLTHPSILPSAVIEAAFLKASKGKFICPQCPSAFKTQQRLTEHLSDVHWHDAHTGPARPPAES